MYRVFIGNTLILHLYSPQRSCGFSYGDTVKNVLRLKGTSESVACLPVSATLCSMILCQNHTLNRQLNPGQTIHQRTTPPGIVVTAGIDRHLTLYSGGDQALVQLFNMRDRPAF